MLLAVLAVLTAANLFMNHTVQVQRIDVPLSALDPERDGFTILSISDLKGASFGKKQSRLAAALKDAHFDAVVCSGDMISPYGNAQPFYDLLDVLHTLNPNAPVYFIAGDSDPDPVSMENAASGSPYAQWVLGARQHGAALLSYPMLLTDGGQSIWLAATSELTLDTDTQQDRFQSMERSAKDEGDGSAGDLAAYHLSRLSGMINARNLMKETDICISLTHTPQEEGYLSMLRAPSGRAADLLICGHWLGGLIRLPVVGALFIPTENLANYGLFAGNAYFGLQSSGDTQVYYNSGLGLYDGHYPPFFRRVFNPPSVSLLTLCVSSL